MSASPGRWRTGEFSSAAAAFLSEQGVDPGPLAVEADRLRADGATVVFVGADDQVAGIIAIADLIKQSTP